jgi:Leucine-rich repeat (LRR) protein
MKCLKHHAQRLATGLLLGMCAVHFAHAATDCNAVTEIPVSECQSLLELYNSTDGANWTTKTGWNQTNTPCSWFGITCGEGYVSHIDLNTNKLTGTLPDLKLPNLKSLDFKYNELSGNIPNFSSLPKLQALNLYVNQLNGSIPNFSHLPNLQDLILGYNQLSGSIPNFSNLPNLQYIYLSSNKLSGSIPDFSNLPNLTALMIENAQLSGNIPNFTNLPNLMALWLDGNQLSGNISNFSNLPNLQSLYLHLNQLSGSIPNFSNLPKLQQLYLYSNKLSGNIPNFSNLPNLQILWFSDNQLSGSIPDFTSFNLANLQMTYFSNNCGLTAYDSAQELILNQKDPSWKALNPNCPISTGNYEVTVNKIGNGFGTAMGNGSFSAGTTINLTAIPDNDSEFAGWSPSPCNNSFLMPSTNLICSATFTLKQFSLNINKPSNGTITGNGIDCGSNCKGTYEINSKVTLTATPANGFEFSNWSGDCSGTNSSLTLTIDKAKNCSANFTQQPTVSKTDCNKVTEIPVSECQSLLELYNSTNGANWRNNTGWNKTNTPCSWYGVGCREGYIKTLHLISNQLSGNIPNFNLPNLETLFLSSNPLTGSIPNFTNLPKLREIDLSYNQLSGNIPDFNNLPYLQYLTLVYNQLSGNIPDFNNLPYLQGLYLANNKLGGSIPNFTYLPYLQGLHLANNKLGGSIPNFNNLSNLRQLVLYDNQLSGNIPNFTNLPYLREISLQNNQLSGSIPNFTNLPNLKQLWLHSNQLSGTIPNFNSLLNLYFYNNCGLTAYNAEQEAILNQRDPDWKKQNSTCLTSSISVGMPRVYISTDRTMYNPASPNLAVFVSAEVIGAPTTEENYDLYLYLKMNNGQILYWSNNQFVVDAIPFLKDLKIPNLHQWIRVIYLTLPPNVPDGNYTFGVTALNNGHVLAEDRTVITYSSTNTDSYTTPTNEIIEPPNVVTLPELNIPDTAPLSFIANVLSIEYPFFKKVNDALLFLNAADTLASGYNQIIADCSLTGGEKKLLVVTKLFDFIIGNAGLTASNLFIDVKTTDSVKSFIQIVAGRNKLIADLSGISMASFNFEHTEWFSSFTSSRKLNVTLDLIYEYSSKSIKNERAASFSVNSDSRYTLNSLKAGMYLLTAKDTTTGQIRRQFLNLDRDGFYDVGFNYREPARTTPEVPCQNIV